jgi:hypothetical protein
MLSGWDKPRYRRDQRTLYCGFHSTICPRIELLDLNDAMGPAMMAYFDERPDEYSNPTAASDRVAAMISSAISVDPEWFWPSVRKSDYRRGG